MIDPENNSVKELIEHLKDQQQIIEHLYHTRYATMTAARDTDRLDRDIDEHLIEEISEMGHIIKYVDDRVSADEQSESQSLAGTNS